MSLCRNLLTGVFHKLKTPDTKVKSIQLLIGELALVDHRALRFAFELLSKDTAAQGAQLEITIESGQAYCRQCDKPYRMSQYYDCCPLCHSVAAEVLKGEAMMIQSMVVE